MLSPNRSPYNRGLRTIVRDGSAGFAQESLATMKYNSICFRSDVIIYFLFVPPCFHCRIRGSIVGGSQELSFPYVQRPDTDIPSFSKVAALWTCQNHDLISLQELLQFWLIHCFFVMSD